MQTTKNEALTYRPTRSSALVKKSFPPVLRPFTKRDGDSTPESKVKMAAMGESLGSVQVSNLKDCLLREVAVRKALTSLVVAQDNQVCSIRSSAARLKDQCSDIRNGLQDIKVLFRESSREAFEAFGGGLLDLVGEFQCASKRHQRESKEDIDSMLDAANRSWQQRNHSLIHNVNSEAARIRDSLGVMRYVRRREEVCTFCNHGW